MTASNVGVQGTGLEIVLWPEVDVVGMGTVLVVNAIDMLRIVMIGADRYGSGMPTRDEGRSYRGSICREVNLRGIGFLQHI